MPLKRPMGLSIEQETYPSGRSCFAILLDGSRVGTVDIPDGGGFRPFGCRKPLPTLDDAVRKLLAMKAKGLRREANRLESYMDVEIGES